jgi:uncharacterized protein (TIGR03083 family)
VRALVGHTSRALLTVEAYLAQPARSVDLRSTADYYAAAGSTADPAAVAQRGRDAGAALGDDPAGAVRAIVARVPPLLDAPSVRGDDAVTTIAGGMRLVDYVPTRTFELVVHTLDLARALGSDAEPPPAAATEALRLVAELAPRRGAAGPILLAATGRTTLGPGFSVL